MNIRVLIVVRELQKMYGLSAGINLLCVLRGEMKRFVGPDGPKIAEYCSRRGLI